MTAFSQFTRLLAGIVCWIAALGLLIQVGLPQRADYTRLPGADMTDAAPEIGSIAPPFTLIAPNLDLFALEQVQDSIVILNFWATWCLPCRREMRELQNLYQSHPSPIRILGINLGESPAIVAQWTKELGLTFDILLDPLQSVWQLYRLRGQPSTYLLDADHRIQNIYFGPVRIEQLAQDIDLIAHS